MRTNYIVNTLALFSLIGSISLLVWWFLMPIFLPLADAAENFQKMILDENRILVNLIGLAAVVCITLGFPVFGNAIVFPIRTIGLILFCTGTVWLAFYSRKTQETRIS